MIVKILGKSATFKGVAYNLEKTDRDKGDLMKVSGFDSLLGIANLKPQDYINYLAAVSARSSKTIYPQFHVIISCKGSSHSGEQLTDIAEKWLHGMGYGDQPYMIVFHRDTANNHVHMVSTRVNRNGLKISDSFERLRSYQVLNQVMGIDARQSAKDDISRGFSFNFSTKAQFALLMENMGYSVNVKEASCYISKYGSVVSEIAMAEINAKVLDYQKDRERLSQLRAIVYKYQNNYSPIVKLLSGSIPENGASGKPRYHSDLAEMLYEKFGISVVFHGKDGKMPYGYSIVDHPNKAVYKGSELMPVAEFISSGALAEIEELAQRQPALDEVKDQTFHLPSEYEGDHDLHDQTYTPGSGHWLDHTGLDISDDVDDEAILGMKRRKKQKARTNTR